MRRYYVVKIESLHIHRVDLTLNVQVFSVFVCLCVRLLLEHVFAHSLRFRSCTTKRHRKVLEIFVNHLVLITSHVQDNKVCVCIGMCKRVCQRTLICRALLVLCTKKHYISIIFLPFTHFTHALHIIHHTIMHHTTLLKWHHNTTHRCQPQICPL